MGYSAIPGVGSQLKTTYQRIITPFDNFLTSLRSSGNASPSGPQTGPQTPGTPGRDRDQDVTMADVTESPTVTRMTTKGARGAPMSVVDKVAERKQAMANGADSDRSARTKHDAKANGELQPASRHYIRLFGYSEQGNLTLTFELSKGTERMERRWTLMMTKTKTTSVRFAERVTARGSCFCVMHAMKVRIHLLLGLSSEMMPDVRSPIHSARLSHFLFGPTTCIRT